MNNTYTNPNETCPGCSGSKIQVNNEGLRVLCPICGGRGMFRPYWQPYYESVSVNTPTNMSYQIYNK